MSTKKSHILIVDDDKDLCQSLAIILKRQGMLVTTVEDGVGAIQAVQHDDFDLILIDLVMPDMNGLETLKALKETAPNSRMVMMTGFAVAGLVAEAIKVGVDGVLYKPFDVNLIIKNLWSENLPRLFEGYLQSVWERIEPVVGAQTAQLIFSQSVDRLLQEAGTNLPGIKVTEDGFSLGEMPVQPPDETGPDWEDNLRLQLQRLLAEVFDLLSMLTGDMLTSPLIEKLSEELKTGKE